MATPEPIAGRCGARVRPKPEQGRAGGYCELHPMRGQTRCGSHGGRAPRALAKAERTLREEAALKLVHRYGIPVAIDPLEAALGGLHETYGAVLALRDAIAQVAPDALTWGLAESIEVNATEFPGVNHRFAAGVSPLVDLYERERDRLHKISTDLVRLGVTLRAEQRDAEVGEYVLGRLRALARALGHEETPAVLAAIRDVLTGSAGGRKELEA